jgi:hypothetical protein
MVDIGSRHADVGSTPLKDRICAPEALSLITSERVCHTQIIELLCKGEQFLLKSIRCICRHASPCHPPSAPAVQSAALKDTVKLMYTCSSHEMSEATPNCGIKGQGRKGTTGRKGCRCRALPYTVNFVSTCCLHQMGLQGVSKQKAPQVQAGCTGATARQVEESEYLGLHNHFCTANPRLCASQPFGAYAILRRSNTSHL